MITLLEDELRLCETDIEGAIYRFFGDEDAYTGYLRDFIYEPTMLQLQNAMRTQEWTEAFMAAHALKGLAANLGFVPLFHYLGELIIEIREGRYDEAESRYRSVQIQYRRLITALRTGLNI